MYSQARSVQRTVIPDDSQDTSPKRLADSVRSVKRRSSSSMSMLKMKTRMIILVASSCLIWILGGTGAASGVATAFVVTPPPSSSSSPLTARQSRTKTTLFTAQRRGLPSTTKLTAKVNDNDRTTASSSSKSSSSSSSSKKNNASAGGAAAGAAAGSAESEYDELRSILTAMQMQSIPSRSLKMETRSAVESLIRSVVTHRPTTIPLRSIATVLPGTTWKLGFSTETATLGDLPKDAQVKLQFYDDHDDDNKDDDAISSTNNHHHHRRRVDYILEFSEKTWGMKRLVAQSSYTVDTSNVNPGLVTFVYETIVTDILGFQNVGVGFFGLLKGRSNYIESIYMDTCLWIERGYTPEGKEFFNVYIRDNWLELIGMPNTASSAAAAAAPPPTTTATNTPLTNLPPIIRNDDQWD